MLIAGQLALRVDERFEGSRGPGAADNPEVTVDLIGVGQLLDERRVVRRPQWRVDPRLGRDRSTDCTKSAMKPADDVQPKL